MLTFFISLEVDMYKRVLLKLSGEVLSGEGGRGFDEASVDYLLEEILPVIRTGTQLAIVIGAGNIVRGRELRNLRNSRADELGMLGTVMNAVYLKEVLSGAGVKAVAVSSIVKLPSLDDHKYDHIEKSLKSGEVVVFGGGTYLPFFTTDTAAAVRAVEIGSDVIIKGTKVDGVYDKDPKKNDDAAKIDRITFASAIENNIEVMDREAFSICQRYAVPVIVIDFFKKGNLLNAIMGEKIGTLVIPD